MRIRNLILLLAVVACLSLAGPAEAATRRQVSIGVSSATITQNQNLTISGSVTPAVGPRVIIQKKWPGQKWKKIATVGIAGNGTYSYTYQLTNLGPRKYRAYVPKYRRAKKSYSPVVMVTVQAPTPVITPDPTPTPVQTPLTTSTAVETGWLPYSNFAEVEGQYTNGFMTARTLQAKLGYFEPLGASFYIDWALSRRCSTVTGLVGIDDDSAAASKFRLEVLVDGAPAYTRDFVLGQSENLNLPVPNALRIRMKVTKIADLSQSTLFNFGDLQALCLP